MKIEIPKEGIATFCRRNHIRKLAFFGSVLRDDFTPESDLGVLVEFEPGARVGLITLAGMEIELTRWRLNRGALGGSGAKETIGATTARRRTKYGNHLTVLWYYHRDVLL